MPRKSLTTAVFLALAVLASLSLRPGADPASAAPEAPMPAAQDPVGSDAVGTWVSKMSLQLVSRTYDAGDDNWTIVAEARLTSNRICVPVVFNCIVGEVSSPSNASLTDLTCQSPLWTHLLVFRNHCLKEVFWAGHQQRFQFTWTTDPGVSTGTVQLDVEFGRGFLPVTFQQLATAGLTVELGTPALEVSKSCPATVDSGATLTCQVTVSHPLPKGGSGPDVNGITLSEKPDPDLQALTSGATLAKASGDGVWDCSTPLVCTSNSLSPGQSATFDYTANVDSTPTGGAGVNKAEVAWSGQSSAGQKEASADVVVVGNGDTAVEIRKATTQTEVTPGGAVSWTVEVENSGPLPAQGVRITDLAPAGVQAMTLEYASGVGSWTCDSLACSAATMPVGTATFTATGTLAANAPTDSAIVNEVQVEWDNDILGPDFPISAGSAIAVVAAATTTTTPGGSTTPGPGSGSGGAPLSVVG